MGELLAKPNETLTEHTKRVLERAREICKRLQLQDELTKRIELACLMHDVGKATQSFQKHICGTQGRAYPHALASFPLALALEAKRFGQGSPKLATAAVLSHHSPLHPTLYQGFQLPDWLHAPLEAWLQEILPKEEADQLIQCIRSNPVQWLHQEVQYPDGSRTLMQQFQRLPVRDFTTVKGVLCLADWLASGGHGSAKIVFLEGGARKLNERLHKNGLQLYDYQQQCRYSDASRLYLHAPTGSGKTEALLLWASDSQRILYLLPTQATANAMWRRLANIYGKKKVGVAHSRALLELASDFEEPPLDVKLFSHVFAKPITVATLDQYLLAHLHGRHWEIRRLLSRHATVLMDEIHAYEPYTLGLLRAALESDPPARLAIASATLPSPLRQTLGDALLVSADENLWRQRRHKITLEESRALEEALHEALEHAAHNETVLFVVNTVPLAQQLYREARAAAAQRKTRRPEVHLLHSRFIYRDRRSKEETIQNPAAGTLLIATQVVEVSLDISFQRLYTELAPLDALVQRMGRVNRKGELPNPALVHILCQYDLRSEYLYGKETLEQTLAALKKLPQNPTNRELSDAADLLYRHIWHSESFQEALQQGRQTLQEVQRICGCYTLDLKDEQMRRLFATRPGEIQIEVLPEQFVQEAYQLRAQKMLWRLPDLLVSVPHWWLIQYPQHFTPVADLAVAVTSLPYSEEVGLEHPAQAQETTSGLEWI
ncbi:MAG: CRISPR-associated helicase Cas3' [bacterium]|nr:CRISPR-associated helicase Cas3' [bacterium]